MSSANSWVVAALGADAFNVLQEIMKVTERLAVCTTACSQLVTCSDEFVVHAVHPVAEDDFEPPDGSPWKVISGPE